MDTFIDKLAQKLTAQEMIKANAAADAAELQRTRTQVAQYEQLLQKISQANRVNEETAKKIQDIVAQAMEKLENTDQIDQVVEACLAKIAEVQGNSLDMAELTPLFDQLTDHVHKENVKVYRNVQAVVQEESAKITENVETPIKSVSGKLTALICVTVAILLVSTASLAFQILQYLQII